MSMIVVPVVALCIPMVIVPTALWFRHARAIRAMEHAERMRALEVGAALPPVPGINWPGAAVCIALGAGVPLGTFVLATLAVVTGRVDPQVFVVALFASLGALWAAKSLAERMLRAAAPVEARNAAYLTAKPAHFDPDAFDVVGSRG